MSTKEESPGPFRVGYNTVTTAPAFISATFLAACVTASGDGRVVVITGRRDG